MDLFSLSAKLSLDSSQYERGLSQAKSGAADFSKSFKRLLGGLAIGAGVKKSFDAVIKLTKKSIKAYAEYEQLVGGVNKLYGSSAQSFEEYAETAADSLYKMGQRGEDVKRLQEELIAAGYDLGEAGADGIYGPKTKAAFEAYAKAGGKLVRDAYESMGSASEKVIENANNAYKTAGMSANQYMETITSFSAALLQSLEGDTNKAVEYADRAIRDMSDNANTFGTDITTIQNAYQGFAKENYTMLDNLRLGYGGTKQEMQHLIADAAKMTEEQEKLGITVDATSLSFDNIVNAISVVQEHMGIAGTTINEANTTIEGSMNSMKAAWENLLVAFSSGDDIQNKVKAFAESAGTVIDNMMPVVEQALASIATFVDEIGPIIIKKLPGVIQSLLPSLIISAFKLAWSLVKALPAILATVVTSVTDAIRTLLRDALGAITGEDFTDSGEISAGAILNAIITGFSSIWNNGAEFAGKLAELINGIDWAGSAESLTTAATNLIDQLFSGLSVDDFSNFASKIGELLGSAMSGISNAGIGIAKAIANWFLSGQVFTTLYNAANLLVSGLWNFITSLLSSIWDNSIIVGYVKQLGDAIGNYVNGMAYDTNIETNIEPEFTFDNSSAGQQAYNLVWQEWEQIKGKIKDGVERDEIQFEVDNIFADLPEDVQSAIESSGFYDQIRQLLDEQFSGEPIEPEAEISPKPVLSDAIDMAEEYKNKLGAELEGADLGGKVATDITGELDMTDTSGLSEKIGEAGKTGGAAAAANIQSELSSKTYDINVNAHVNGMPEGAVVKNARAMNPGRIFRRPTIFGAAEGAFQMAGDAGPEAVVGTNSLNRMIQTSVASAMQSVVHKMDGVISAMPSMAGMGIYWNGDLLVGEITPGLDNSFGKRSAYRERGNA